jgi:hypothetical protein
MLPYLYSENHINPGDLEYLKSLLNPDNNENNLNKNLKISGNVEYNDKILFDWVDNNIIYSLNHMLIEENHSYSFLLIKNNIEVIEYQEGDFVNSWQNNVNTDTNDFKIYTFILSLNNCQEGGELFLHNNDNNNENEIEFNNKIQNSGTLFLFQKDIIYGQKIIKKGTKYIMRGNLLCVKNNIADLLIINLKKSYGYIYIIPIEYLQNNKKCLYYTFYTFQKTQNKDQKIFYYDEQILDYNSFNIFYEQIMPHFVNINEIKKNLDYIGFIYDEFLFKFNKFIKGNCENNGFFCNDNDYYHLLTIDKPNNIIPFQMISVTIENEEFILWFGLYDNLFATCDWRINIHPDDFEVEEIIEILNKQFEDDDKLCIDNYNNLIPAENGWYLIGEGDYEKNEIVRKYIWDNFKFKKLSDISSIKSNNVKIELTKYIKKFIKSLPDDYDHRPENYNTYKSNIVYNTISESLKYINNDINNDIKCNFDQSIVKDIDINKLIDTINNYGIASKIYKTSMTEYCGYQLNHVTFEIVSKFGFININNLDDDNN